MAMVLELECTNLLASTNKSSSTFNLLLQKLASNGETGGVIAIWDHMKDNNILVNDTALKAMKKLHDRGSDGTFIIDTGKCALKPSRRLHKIFKGKRLSDRNKEAKQYVLAALDLISNNKIDTKLPRIALAKSLAKTLNIKLEVARGLVTTLKRKKAIP